jgi:hypothetical protein
MGLEIVEALPRPAQLRKALALNLRERKALELTLKASEFVVEQVKPLVAVDGKEGSK